MKAVMTIEVMVAKGAAPGKVTVTIQEAVPAVGLGLNRIDTRTHEHPNQGASVEASPQEKSYLQHEFFTCV
jgi:hypothetical protein